MLSILHRLFLIVAAPYEAVLLSLCLLAKVEVLTLKPKTG